MALIFAVLWAEALQHPIPVPALPLFTQTAPTVCLQNSEGFSEPTLSEALHSWVAGSVPQAALPLTERLS